MLLLDDGDGDGRFAVPCFAYYSVTSWFVGCAALVQSFPCLFVVELALYLNVVAVVAIFLVVVAVVVAVLEVEVDD